MGIKNKLKLVHIVAIFAILLILGSLIQLLGTQYFLYKEKFSGAISTNPSKVITLQGYTIPTEPTTEVTYDQDPSMTTVDGTPNTPRSMFMMAFNKCDPSCCPSTYSCSGGCVCMTDAQKNFIGKRGNNGATRCRLQDNPEY